MNYPVVALAEPIEVFTGDVVCFDYAPGDEITVPGDGPTTALPAHAH